jgi:hypothetical protein
MAVIFMKLADFRRNGPHVKNEAKAAFLALLALITVIAASVLTANNQENQARVDFLARGGFPAAFLLLLGWFLMG